MTDEANVELFSMVDQLVEGHQWLLHTFNFKPKSSWSVDPFGHGAAFPYVLKASGVDGEFLRKKWQNNLIGDNNRSITGYILP